MRLLVKQVQVNEEKFRRGCPLLQVAWDQRARLGQEAACWTAPWPHSCNRAARRLLLSSILSIIRMVLSWVSMASGNREWQEENEVVLLCCWPHCSVCCRFLQGYYDGTPFGAGRQGVVLVWKWSSGGRLRYGARQEGDRVWLACRGRSSASQARWWIS